MRRLTTTIAMGVALVIVAFLVGRQFSTQQASSTTTTATHSPSLTLPILSEDFTLLACNHSTTIGLEGCAEHQIVALDLQINNMRHRLFSSLMNTGGRRNFVNAELSWTAYRSSLCLSASSAYQGGTLAPVAYATCLVQSDQRHLSALRELAQQLSHP
jgi:uncharacterized protein YecT (DUF1311 family)